MSLPTDKELDDYLQRGSEVSRRYRALVSEEPPVELDQAVLSQARAAVDASASPVAGSAHRKMSRWAVPFAAAATVILSFLIFRGMGPDALMQGTSSPASAPVQTQVLRESGEGIAADRIAADREESFREESLTSKTEGRSGKSLRDTVAPIMHSAPPARQRAEVSAEQKKSQPEFLVGSAAPASAPAPVPPPAESAASLEAAKAVMAKRDSSDVYMSSAFEHRDSKDSKSANIDLQRAQDKTEAVLPRSAPVWLSDIRKLRAEGKQTEADAELKRFLEEYPNYFEKNPAVSRP